MHCIQHRGNERASIMTTITESEFLTLPGVPTVGLSNLLNEYISITADDTAIVVFTAEVQEAATWVVGALRARGVAVEVVPTRPFKDEGLSERLKAVIPAVQNLAGTLYFFVMESQSLSHSKVHEQALSSLPRDRVRVVWLHNSSRELFELGLAVTPGYLEARNATLLSKLTGATRLNITSTGGTDLEVGLDGRYKWGSNRGMAAAGERLVLPGGEINTYAAEINGTLVVDGAVHLNRIVRGKVGGLRETPILIDIVDGVAQSIECADPGLRGRMHEWLADDNAKRVGELGFGTNTGVDRFTDWNSRINERAPSVHIGLGQHDQAPKLVGYWADIHLDLIMADSQLHIEDEPPFDLRDFANESVSHPESLSNADGAAADASMPHVS